MTTVHWLGAGLSSVPGIRRLAVSVDKMVLWNRTASRAREAISGLDNHLSVAVLDWQKLAEAIKPGDVVVSMLPGSLHIKVAELCLSGKANFVSSSYISAQMQSLHSPAVQLGLSFVNEVGLDPGLDHLFAHSIIANYKNSFAFNPSSKHYFRSYCGGFPKIANEFTYKFSWSPLGVLKALKTPAQWIASGEITRIKTPWKAVSEYSAKVLNDREVFQAYPNRDSLPFIKEYGINEDWNLQEFVRGTLRLEGWTGAWATLFDEVENLQGAEEERRLTELSQQLWEKYAYEPQEPDRVVLSVELEVRDTQTDKVEWHQTYNIDEYGDADGSAMARLVSLTVSLAVESVLAGELPVGVSAAAKDIDVVNDWLASLRTLGIRIPHRDHLA